MKLLKIFFLQVAVFLAALNYSFAQNPVKRDTIFYLVDTAGTATRDRMFDIGLEGPFKYYSIRCMCLKYNKKPVFVFNYTKDNGKTLNNLNTLKFISLSELINLSRESGGDIFNNKHIAFFVERIGKKYVKHTVTLLKPVEDVVTYDLK